MILKNILQSRKSGGFVFTAFLFVLCFAMIVNSFHFHKLASKSIVELKTPSLDKNQIAEQCEFCFTYRNIHLHFTRYINHIQFSFQSGIVICVSLILALQSYSGLFSPRAPPKI